MIALAQGSAGLALVMCFALLRTGRTDAAAILLAVQSAAVAITALVLHQPLMAMPPLILGAAFWLVRRETLIFHTRTAPIGGAKLGIGIGALLAILCQSQAGLALPSAIVLMSVLLAVTRAHPLMQVLSLLVAQNGLVLAGCLLGQPESLTLALLPAALLLPIACLLLPVPLAAGLLVPAIASSPNRLATQQPVGLGMLTPGASAPPAVWWPSRVLALPRAAAWLGWIDIGLALAVLAATLGGPLEPLASLFAPLLGLDGVLRSCVRRKRSALTLTSRASSLLQNGCLILAVAAPTLVVAWLALLAAMAMALLPAMSRRWGSAVLAFLAAAISLFGILLLSSASPVLGYFSLFAGFAMIAGVVPDCAVVLTILILRLGDQAPWPPGVEALGIGVSLVGLFACAILLTNSSRSRRTTLLLLGQASIAALAICIGYPEARFAALVLLILLILSRAAARVTAEPVATLAVAGLGGLPPLGVFPGLVLVVLTISAHAPWLLLPVGVALVPIVLASAPRCLPAFLPATKAAARPPKRPSVAWLPLLLALAAGYFAPHGLIHWWRILTAGRS